MSKYNINNFYPCKTINVGSELYYICELGKYLKNYNDILSLSGVKVDTRLKNSKFWLYLQYAIENGYVTDINIDTDDIFDYSKLNKTIFTSDISANLDKLCFVKQGKELILEYVDNINYLGDGGLHSQAFVSLIAYMTIERTKKGYPEVFHLKLNQIVLNVSSLVDIICLQSTSAIKDWCKVDIAVDTNFWRDCNWKAYVYDNMQRGEMQRKLSPSEKKAYFKSLGYKVGDLILIYNKGGEKETDNIRKIKETYFAVIEKITDDRIFVREVKKKDTVFGETLAHNKDKKNTYSNVFNYKGRVCDYRWIDIGIGRKVFNEQYFIEDLNKEDEFIIKVTDGKRENRVKLLVPDTCYWVLKDRGIQFDEEHFKEVYKNYVPLAYDRYMNGEEIPEIVG